MPLFCYHNMLFYSELVCSGFFIAVMDNIGFVIILAITGHFVLTQKCNDYVIACLGC